MTISYKEMTHSNQSQLDSFLVDELPSKQCVDTLLTQRQLIMDSLREWSVPLCDAALSQLTGYEINIVNARRNELLKKGLVERAFKAKSPFSDRLVSHWRLTIK